MASRASMRCQTRRLWCWHGMKGCCRIGVELSGINPSSAGYEPVNPDLHGSTIMSAGCAGACFSARRRINQHQESRDMPEIMPLQPTDAARWLPQLIVLLQDAVDSGA